MSIGVGGRSVLGPACDRLDLSKAARFVSMAAYERSPTIQFLILVYSLAW